MTHSEPNQPADALDSGTELPYATVVVIRVEDETDFIPPGACRSSESVDAGEDRRIRINFTASPHPATVYILENGQVIDQKGPAMQGSLDGRLKRGTKCIIQACVSKKGDTTVRIQGDRNIVFP